MQDKKIKNGIEIYFKIPFSLLITISGIFTIFLYVFLPNFRGELTFIASVLGTVAAVLSAFYVGYSIKMQTREQKLKNTFDFLAHYDTIDYLKLDPYIQDNFHPDKISVENFYDETKKDKELFTAIRARYNFFEDMSLAIQSGFIDEQIIRNSLAGVVKLHCQKFGPWLEKHSKNFPYPDHIYCETKKLRDAWGSDRLLTEL